MFQHFFWFFGHPEVYIILLPALGVINHSLLHLHNSSILILSMISITVFSLIVWVHHMYTASTTSDYVIYFTIATILISIPSGIKVFAYITGVYTSCVYTRSLYSSSHSITCLFVSLFVLGGVTGIVL